MLLQERKQIQIPGSLDDMSVCLSNSFSSDSDHVRVDEPVLVHFSLGFTIEKDFCFVCRSYFFFIVCRFLRILIQDKF